MIAEISSEKILASEHKKATQMSSAAFSFSLIAFADLLC